MGRAGSGPRRPQLALRQASRDFLGVCVQHRGQVQVLLPLPPRSTFRLRDVGPLFPASSPAQSRMVPRSPWSAARISPGGEHDTLDYPPPLWRRPPRPGCAGSPASWRAARPCTGGRWRYRGDVRDVDRDGASADQPRADVQRDAWNRQRAGRHGRVAADHGGGGGRMRPHGHR